jgi:hypothetical protein
MDDTKTASVANAKADELWATLDMRKQGQLDLAGLKKGLRKLDHRGNLYSPGKGTSLTGCCSSQERRRASQRCHESCRRGRKWPHNVQGCELLT